MIYFLLDDRVVRLVVGGLIKWLNIEVGPQKPRSVHGPRHGYT